MPSEFGMPNLDIKGYSEIVNMIQGRLQFREKMIQAVQENPKRPTLVFLRACGLIGWVYHFPSIPEVIPNMKLKLMSALDLLAHIQIQLSFVHMFSFLQFSHLWKEQHALLMSKMVALFGPTIFYSIILLIWDLKHKFLEIFAVILESVGFHNWVEFTFEDYIVFYSSEGTWSGSKRLKQNLWFAIIPASNLTWS